MIDSFTVYLPKTIMGPGSLSQLGDLVKSFGAKKVLIVTDAGVVAAGLVDKVKPHLDKIRCKYDIFDRCLPNAPTNIIDECTDMAVAGKFDLLIAVGGGSTMDSCKMVSLLARNGMKSAELIDSMKAGKKLLPKIMIPTTSGTGSEWGNGSIVTDMRNGMKKGVRLPQVWADAAIVDAELMLNLPARITADTGMDVLTHAIEGYTSCKAGIVSDALLEKVIRLVADNLRLVYAKGQKHIEARHNMAVAASMALGGMFMAGVGLVHALDGHVIERAHISHGAALTILLPAVMEYNLLGVPEKFAAIAQLMGEDVEGLSMMEAARKSVDAVRSLARDLGMAQTLSEVGIKEADLPGIVDDFTGMMGRHMEANNPRNATREEVIGILKSAL
jgi:alcohol dehydrogenase class IV